MFKWSLAPILSLLQGKTSLKIVASDWLKTSSFDWLKLLSFECGTGALLTCRLDCTGVLSTMFLFWILSGTCVCKAALMLSSKYCFWIFADVIFERGILVQDRYFLILLLDDAVSNLFFFAGNFLLLG